MQPAGTPTRDELIQLYQAAMEDYRFQVNLTSTRTQFCLVLNSALLGVAASIEKLGTDTDYLVLGVLAAALAITTFSLLVIDAGRAYYKPVNARLAALEQELGIQQFAVRTTSSQGGQKPRFRVTTLLKAVFIALGIIELAGAGYIVERRLYAPTKKPSLGNSHNRTPKPAYLCVEKRIIRICPLPKS